MLFSACEEPSTIGAGLLGNEELQIEFTDAVPIKARVIPDDSTSISRQFGVMSIGTLDEPIFGATTNQLFLSTSLNAIFAPDFAEGTLDSVVLRINLDEDTQYGVPDAVHQVEVFQLSEKIGDSLLEIGENLDSTTELEFGDKLGETSFVANYDSTVLVQIHCAGQDTLLSPHLRVRLEDDFGDQFMGLSQTELNDTTFQNLAKGFLIRNTPSADNMLALDFLSGESFLEFFYTDLDTTRCYSANVGLVRFLNVQHEHAGSGSEVEAALNDTSDDQERLFVEPYAGVNIEFDISELLQFQDKVINNVAIDVTLETVDGFDYENFPPMPNMSLSYRDEDGDYRLISDITSTGGTLSLIHI